MKTASQLVAYLNAINVGDMDKIRAKLGAARRACIEIEQEELADKLVQAEQALDQADMKTYRKRVQTVISRLGHIR